MCVLKFYMHLMLLIYLCCEFYVSFKKAKATTSVGRTYVFTGLYNGSVTLEEKYQCNHFGAIKKIISFKKVVIGDCLVAKTLITQYPQRLDNHF